MAEPQPLGIASRFLQFINAGDVDGLADMMTPDHEFIDRTGASLQGREKMRQAWASYFALFPDYRIEPVHFVVRGQEVLIQGVSHGTLTEAGKARFQAAGISTQPDELQGTFVWLSLVRGGQVARWQILADTAEQRQALGLR